MHVRCSFGSCKVLFAREVMDPVMNFGSWYVLAGTAVEQPPTLGACGSGNLHDKWLPNIYVYTTHCQQNRGRIN